MLGSASAQDKNEIAMPNYANLQKEFDNVIECPWKKSKVTLSYWQHHGMAVAISATRKGKDKPYAVVWMGRHLYLDNGVNGGTPEDGKADGYQNLMRYDSNICDDIPR